MFFSKKMYSVSRNKKASSRRFLLREIQARSDTSIEEARKWISKEYYENYNDVFYLKLYFEWKFVLRKEEFTMDKLINRDDEDEFVEILNIIEEVLGVKYYDFPFKFKKTINRLREEINGSQRKYNSRKDCYIWTNE